MISDSVHDPVARTISSLGAQVDKTIDGFQSKFIELQGSFTRGTVLDIAIQVRLVMGAVKDLSTYIYVIRIIASFHYAY